MHGIDTRKAVNDFCGSNAAFFVLRTFKNS